MLLSMAISSVQIGLFPSMKNNNTKKERIKAIKGLYLVDLALYYETPI